MNLPEVLRLYPEQLHPAVRDLLGAGFKAEYTIIAVQRYRVDFAHPVFRLVVEFDNCASHAGPVTRARDAKKDERLRERGWAVTRIPHGEPVIRKGWNPRSNYPRHKREDGK